MSQMQNQDNQQKICYSIKGAVNYTDFSRSYFFDAIKKGKIKTFKRGSRRFILHNDLVEFILSESNQGEVKQ